jgi:hypothetical protein
VEHGFLVFHFVVHRVHHDAVLRRATVGALYEQRVPAVSSWLIVAMGVVYLYVGIEQLLRGDTGHAVMFAGYALANGGLAWSVR